MAPWLSDSRPFVRSAAAEPLVCADLLESCLQVFRRVAPGQSCDLIALDTESGRMTQIEVSVGYRRRDGSIRDGNGHRDGQHDVVPTVHGFDITYTRLRRRCALAGPQHRAPGATE